MDIFELKRLFIDEASQQPLVDWTMLFTDLGLGTVMLVLAALMTWRLVDLFKKNGRWKRELAEAAQEVSQ